MPALDRAGAADRSTPRLRVVPVTPARWGDLCTLFGEKGACGGCWCMTPRLPRREYEAGKGAGNKRRLHRLVERGPAPGLLGYLGREPVAWIAIAPREEYTALARSRVLAPVDARPVWSIVCLFVRRDRRRQGLSEQLIEGAARWAKRRGAIVVEGYPTAPRGKRVADVFAWTGFARAFERAGFVEVARRSATRPIVRREVL